MTRHCWKCGTEYKLSGAPGRSETCESCCGDLKVCLNCVSYDRAVAHQCRDRRADPVEEKHLANYCSPRGINPPAPPGFSGAPIPRGEYFEMARRVFVPPAEEKSRETRARSQLKNLLGD